MALVRQVALTNAAPAAALVAGGAASTFFGLAATNGLAAAAYYIKLWWEGTGVPPPTTPLGSQPATGLPVVGTTVPNLTIEVPIGGIYNLSFQPVNNGGRLWYWVTAAPGPTDTTALTTGGDQVTFIYG